MPTKNGDGKAVVLSVINIKVAENYGTAAIEAAPIAPLLYAFEIPEEGYEGQDLDGKQILNIEGIRHVIQGLRVALIFEVDAEEDF